MWYYTNLCRCANVLYSSRAQSLLFNPYCDERGEKQLLSTVVLSQFISKQLGKLWRTSKLLQVNTIGNRVGDVWYHANSTFLHLQQTLCKDREGVKLAVHCTCFFLVGSQRGAENWATTCKCTNDKSWFCLSGTFLYGSPAAYHSLHSFSSKLS